MGGRSTVDLLLPDVSVQQGGLVVTTYEGTAYYAEGLCAVSLMLIGRYNLVNRHIYRNAVKKRFSDCSHVPKSDNTSEITGVSYHKKSQKWVSQIIFKQTHIWLGQYITKENAIYSRHIAEQILKLNNYNIPITHPMYEKILKYIKKKCDPF